MVADLGWLTARAVADAPLPTVVWAATAVGQGLMVPTQLWLTKLFLDALQARLSGAGGGGVSPLWWLGGLGASLLMGRALAGLQDWVRVLARERQGPAAQARVLEQAAALDLATFEHQGYYDHVRRVLEATEGSVPDAIGQVIGLGETLPPLLGYVAALALLSPTLLMVSIAATLPTVLGWTLLGQAAWGANAAFTRLRRLADYYAGLLTGRGAAAELRLYGLAGHAECRWSELFWRARDGARMQALRHGTGLRALGTASLAVMMVALWWVALNAGLHASAGTLTVLFQSVEGVFGGGFRLGDAARRLGAQSGFAAEYRAFFTQPRNAAGHATTVTGVGHGEAPPVGVRLSGVSFTYPGAVVPAVHDVTLELVPGETVALVGDNGAGKTTLTKLMLGLYRPDAGDVVVGPRGTDATVRKSAVFQDFSRYPLSLAENITVGAPDTGARLSAVLAQVGADGLGAHLPVGIDTVLGADIGGSDLSGGQWQRVALARALWRQPQLLVLDEPTAALDPQAELAVFRQFAALARGRTTVLVSHRLGICRLADRVVVLQAGRVVEVGPHARLVEAAGPPGAGPRSGTACHAVGPGRGDRAGRVVEHPGRTSHAPGGPRRHAPRPHTRPAGGYAHGARSRRRDSALGRGGVPGGAMA